MQFSTTLATLLPLALAAPAPAPASDAAAKAGYKGDMTHYDVGLGSCGFTNNDGQAVVALATSMMQNGANPNANPLCGKTITIDYAGKQHQAKIVDTCTGCAFQDIDLSPSLFKAVAPQGNGRVHNVHWWFDETKDGKRP